MTERTDTFSGPTGELRLTWPANLTAEEYEDVAEWMDLVRRKMSRAAQIPKPAEFSCAVEDVHPVVDDDEPF